MPEPVPAYLETFNAIIRELNALVEQPLDEFTRIRRLNELEKQALGLEHLSLAHSLSVLGNIAADRGSLKKMHEYHKKAMTLLPRDPIILLNYGTSLERTGLLDQAWTLISPYVCGNPGDLRGLDMLVRIAFEKGDEALFLEQARAWKRLKGEEHPLYAEYLAETEETRELSAACAAATATALDRLRD